MRNRPNLHPTFPSGQHPPNRFVYEILYTNPPLFLQFTQYEYRPDRNESEIELLYRDAIRWAIDPSQRASDIKVKMFQEDNNYQYLYVRNDDTEETTLSRGLFLEVLIGLNRFREAYPGLYFYFLIYQNSAANPQEGTWLGRGASWGWSLPNSPDAEPWLGGDVNTAVA